jgi:hypothetical protein
VRRVEAPRKQPRVAEDPKVVGFAD